MKTDGRTNYSMLEDLRGCDNEIQKVILDWNLGHKKDTGRTSGSI